MADQARATGAPTLDGVLVVYKPTGPTSHDVVAQVRRALGSIRVGHTGTLDPAADGVLILLLGRATRLAPYLADEKEYMATVQLGSRTDSYDATGTPVGAEYDGPFPSDDAIDAALAPFRGTYMQRPPLFSAKHIGGRRGHAVARQERLAGRSGESSVTLEPVSVTVHRLDLIAISPPLVTLDLVVAAGFYVRSLAHDLGEALGTGAHLAALTRTRVGPFVIDQAIAPANLGTGSAAIDATRAALMPMARALPRLESVTLTLEGATRVARGQDITRSQIVQNHPATGPVGPVGPVSPVKPLPVKLLNEAGDLLALAERRYSDGSDVLHPSVVLV